MENTQLQIISEGLERINSDRNHVIVVGAGMAGLVSAYELKRAGFEVTILEARDRICGRVYTVREPFEGQLYGEVGAMRIPVIHNLTLNYVEKFDLETIPFNTDMPYNFSYFNGQRMTPSDIASNFNVIVSIFDKLDQEANNILNAVSSAGGDWYALLEQYDDVSLYDHLLKVFGIHELVQTFGHISAFDCTLDGSALELLQVAAGFGADKVQLVGGMDQLPQAFLDDIEQNLQLGAQVNAIDYDGSSVTVYYARDGAELTLTADYMILTVPFSTGKQWAIRNIPYMDATKVLLQFKRRFWEEDDQIYVGGTITELPNQFIYYLERKHVDRGGVLIGTYAVGVRAHRWSMLSDEEAISESLKRINQIHPSAKDEFVNGFVMDWGRDRFAGGAFVIFKPGQKEQYYTDMVSPEGPIHIAGAHASHYHAWIEGAVESALRAVQEIYDRVINES